MTNFEYDPAMSVAAAALITALGGTPAEADAVTLHLRGVLPPRSPSAVIEQVQKALDAVRTGSDEIQ